jgi:flagella basal body P-ring formation protein FlgA
MRRILTLLLCLPLLSTVPAQARQDPVPVHQVVDAWLKIQTQGLPGQVNYTIGDLAPDNQLAPCASFDVGRPAGARPWGRTHVQVRCLDAAAWRINIAVHVRIKADYLISARPISRGQPITAEDLAAKPGDLSDLPANILTDPDLALGKTATVSIPAGRPLRADMLKAQTVIRQGQTVKIVSRGPGFSVANDGRALNAAVAGEVVQIRLANGQVVSGIAGPTGAVEITY